jgi:hypothetical protein
MAGVQKLWRNATGLENESIPIPNPCYHRALRALPTSRLASQVSAPVVGDIYRTQKSGEVGLVIETAENRTGSTRVCMIVLNPSNDGELSTDLTIRWSTYVPC